MTIPSKGASTATSILLFFIYFALWQIYDFIIVRLAIPVGFITLLYLSIPAISLVFFVLFTKLTKSTFKNQGFKKPVTLKTQQCILLSLSFVAIYVLITMAAGFVDSIGSVRIPIDPFGIIMRTISAIIFGLSIESVFRGYIFRNLVKNYSFFTSLYASSILSSLHSISIRDILDMTTNSLITYIFTDILTAVAAGLFLGFFFYKIGWSLLGPATFSIGLFFYLEPIPIMGASSLWWLVVTFKIMAYASLILILDYTIKEPRYRRRRYGLE